MDRVAKDAAALADELKEVEADPEAEQMLDVAARAHLALEKDRAKVAVTTLADFKNGTHPGSLAAAAGELFEAQRSPSACPTRQFCLIWCLIIPC